jgi:hypothetical protein
MHRWEQWIPIVEWSYNNTYHGVTKMTPYEFFYAPKPLSMESYVPDTSKVDAVDITLHNRESIILIPKDNLFMAQNRMKYQVDQHTYEHYFNEGDQVFLGTKPYKQKSLKDEVPQKLSLNFYGSYQIIQHIGQVANKLSLSTHSKIHLVFHVSCLKKVVGSNCKVKIDVLELDEEGSIWIQLEAVLDIRECQLCQCMIKEVLIQWKDMQSEDATWELIVILQQFPLFSLEDNTTFESIGNVRVLP